MVSGDIKALGCACSTVRVRVHSVSAPQQAQREGREKIPLNAELIDAAWGELCSTNTRLHDGLILGVDAFDGSSGEFDTSPAAYRNLAAQGYTIQAGPCAGSTVPDLGVRLLGVKALITAAGSDGQDHVLILRRSPEVRVYANMWEVGPGGGVEVPHGPMPVPSAGAGQDGGEMTWTGLLATLAREAMEELAVDLSIHCHAPSLHGVYADHVAASFDIVVGYRWKATVNPKAGWCHIGERNWEYSDAAWLSKADTARWAANAKLVSPLARVVLTEWAGRQ